MAKVKQGNQSDASHCSHVQSIERAMNLLEVLGEDAEGYRLTDLAIRTGLSPSTVHRILTTLESHRFVQFDQTYNTWHVGRQTFTIGSVFARQRNFVAPALPYLRRLRDQSRETANLGVVDGGEIVVLTQVESREITRAISGVGGRVPMVVSGMGKAILATYSQEDVSALISTHGMPRMTHNSIVRASRLKDELTGIRARGYAIDNEEYVVGLRCIAAVVYNRQAEPLCAISISGLAGRMTEDRLQTLGRLVADTAKMLTVELGGEMPA